VCPIFVLVFLMVDMVWDMRSCETLDLGNGRLRLDVDNRMDFRVSLPLV
jgi:hypothetical protein